MKAGDTNGGLKTKSLTHASYDNAVGHPEKWEKSEEREENEEERKVSMLELFRFADKMDVLLTILGLISAAASGMSWPALAIVFGEMLDSFLCYAVAPNEVATNEVTTNAMSCIQTTCGKVNIHDEIQDAAIRFSIVGAGAWLTMYLYVMLLLWAAERQTRRMREAFFRAIMRQEIGWFDTSDPGELATRLTDDLNKVFNGIGDKIGAAVQWSSSFIGGIIVGLVSEWRLSLVIFGVTPILATLAALVAKLVASYTMKEQKAYAQAGSVAEEVISCMRTVVAFGGEDKEARRYQVEVDKATAVGKKKSLSSGVVMGATWFLIFGIYALSFWFSGYLIREEGASAGDVMTTFFAVILGAFSLGNVAPNAEAISEARGAAVRVFEIQDRESEIDPLSDKGEKPAEDTVKGNLEFKNIQFCYPARPDVEVMRNLNLTVNQGETVALVGPSGCGKSTVIQLLQRFYNPIEGQILLDGHDVKTLNVHWLRKHIGVVSQEPVLFASSIAENIRYGSDNVTDEQIREAARQANAHDFIMKLPQKYNTLVGERGAQLSGGQKQRVAIARALVRNPKILLLDEATSALDTESEGVVQSALDKARQGRTTIVIAHRLSTVQNATSIASIVSGEVVEKGTHSELMERKGVYYELVMAQQVGEDNVSSVQSPMSPTSPTDIWHSRYGRSVRSGSRHGSKRGQSPSFRRRQYSSQVSSESGGVARQRSFYGRQSSGGGESVQDIADKVIDEGPPPPAPSMIRIMKMTGPEWKQTVLGLLGAAGSGVIMPVFSIVFARLLRIFGEPCDEMEDKVAIWAPAFVYVGVASGIFQFSKGFFLGSAGEALTGRLRRLTFRAMLRQDIGWFDDPRRSTGALTTRLAADASEVKGTVGSRFGAVIELLSTLIAALTVSLYHNWEMTFVSLAFIPLLIGAGAFQMKSLAGHTAKNKDLVEEAGTVAVEAVENIRTVAQLTREETFWQKYHDCLEGPFKLAIRHAHIRGFFYGLANSILFFAYAGSFRFGGWQVEHQADKYDMEDVFIVFAAIVFGAFSVGQALSFAPDYSKARIAAARVFDLLDTVPAIDSSSKDGYTGTVDGHIAFCNVQFSYPTRPDVTILNGLDLTIEPGQTVALVGASGCGKSTCIQLLERFYDPKEGSVDLTGYNIKEINIQHLRSQFGLVSQEPVLFACSIRENIAYGDNSREVFQEEIEAAAADANIHNFIAALPNGYDTMVGEKGTQLSGGQKQRVAIARALLRNPKILLLDEATSALDTESEKIVQEALDQAREGRTCLVIAHRLSTIHTADKIVVFQNGKVVEQGTHGELMKLKGVYYKLNQAQVHNIM